MYSGCSEKQLADAGRVAMADRVNSISPVGTPKETGKYRLAPRIQRSVLVSVAESKGDYKVRRLGVVKFQGAWSVVTPLPEVYDLGCRLHPC